MQTIMPNNRLLLILWSLLLFLGISCSEEEDPVPDPVVVQNSKTAIYDAFKEWYFWLDKLPEVNPNGYSSDQALLEALRYDELDRWSFIAPLDEYLALFQDAETKGFGVSMAQTLDKKLMVRFAYKQAPMGSVGVHRGWEILKIDGVPVKNIPNLNVAFDTDNEVVFTFVTTANDTVEHAVTRTNYKINTVLHRSVIDHNGTKVGYLVYESFIGEKTDELDEAFELFQSEGVEELVIDLRYNGGGRLDIAMTLGELIGGDEVVGQVMGKMIYNSKKSGDNIAFGTNEENPLRLNLDRLFFITTKETASASEMMINSMFPYKEIVTLGQTTHGKPVGMTILQAKKYNLALAPVTFKILNANDEGDYFDGIPVDYEVVDDIFKAWGNPQEACLSQALSVIDGSVIATSMKSSQIHPVGIPLKRGLQEITGAH